MTVMVHRPMPVLGTRVVVEPVPVARPVDGRVRARVTPRPIACSGSVQPDIHGSRLTRRGRLIVTAVWLALALAGALAFVRPESEPVESGATVTVQSGDTLWDLAGDVAPSVDRRDAVAAIVELNDLGSVSGIQAGDVLLVPALSR